MISNKKIISTIITGTIFITTLGFTSISAAGNENSAHDSHATMKRNSEGKVSQKVFMQHHKWMFKKSDRDNDGFLDNTEMGELHKRVKAMHKRFEKHCHEEH